MSSLLAEIFLTIFGWLYLLIKYRNISRMCLVVKEKYDNEYAAVGRKIISSTFLIIFAVMIFGLILLGIFMFFR